VCGGGQCSNGAFPDAIGMFITLSFHQFVSHFIVLNQSNHHMIITCMAAGMISNP